MSECDEYVYPGSRWSKEGGICTGHGQGLTVRDWFAASASEDDITSHRKAVKNHAGTILRWSFTREEARYRFADAMIAQRSKGSEG